MRVAIGPFETRYCEACGTAFQGKGVTRFCSQSCVNRGRRRPSLRERFERRVASGVTSECWPWTGPSKRNGYGSMRWEDGRWHGAHRIAYAIASGSMPPSDVHVCHSCDNPPCCNPAHLFVGTPTENAHDRDAKGRTSQGERHYAAKLTAADVLAIRASSESHSALARELGVSISSVFDVRKGTKWKGVRANG